MTYSTISSVIKIMRKGSTAITMTGEIFNFTEKGLDRKVTYTKVVGGKVIPRLENNNSYEVTFDFILNSTNIETLMSTNPIDFDLTTYANNLYKIVLNFTEGANFYTKRYYNCFITNLQINPTDEVLKGKITFTLPKEDNLENHNLFSGFNETTADAYDTTMTY